MACFLLLPNGPLKAARIRVGMVVNSKTPRYHAGRDIEMQPVSNDLHRSETSEMRTSSRLRVWYLVQFRGYKVTQCKEVPKVTKLGRLTYECHWHLQPEAEFAARNPTNRLS